LSTLHLAKRRPTKGAKSACPTWGGKKKQVNRVRKKIPIHIGRGRQKAIFNEEK